MTFFEYLKKQGYLFDSKLVENFLLSLKVKPFIILTGNSGTGKTKLAQLYAQYLNPELDEFEDSYHTVFSLKRSITTYSRNNNGGWRFKPAELKLLCKQFNSKTVDDIPEELTLQIDHDGRSIKGKGYLQSKMRSYSNDPQVYLYYVPDTPIHEVLSQNNGEVTINLLKKNIKLINNKRYEIVPVGANWTENRHIVGFYNVITENYNFTKALKLIINAKQNETEPYFLILDEMNLSHVERYFSDFLSAMESNEDIELHSNDHIKSPPSKIKLSSNLFVIGTVNVDETTYMFSPKVLDRANTLEFLTQSVTKYMTITPKYNVDGNEDYLYNPLSDIELRGKDIRSLQNLLQDVRTPDNQPIWDTISTKLFNFQEDLSLADFEFGFRTVNEIIRFMIVSWRYEGEPEVWENWERYFDAQIFQKMLPKLHGSQRELGDVLKKLRQNCNKANSNEVIFPYSAQKLDKMIKKLSEKRYVAFTG